MKFGMRKPSIKRSISARTTGRAKRAVKRAIIPGYGRRGMGILHPKKALYNRVYRRTTFSIFDLAGASSRRGNAGNSGCCLTLLLLVSAIAFLCACSQPSKANDSSNGSSEYSSEYTYDTNPAVPEASKDSTKQMDPATVARILNSDYGSDPEDAYEEGVAQAEEDRLAGHPGANYADDYDDDDENEAYEEGYEDE
jgi:hypothetical protein